MASILQWNCRDLRAAWEELNVLLSQFSLACVSLKETMIRDAYTSSPASYSVFYSAYSKGQGHQGGDSLLVRHGVPVTLLELETTLQAVAVRLFLNRPYTVCSLYIPPGGTGERDDFVHLVRELPSPFILLDDFNGRHPLCCDCMANRRGDLLAWEFEIREI